MTSVDPSGAARPGRVAGLALLGIAAVALVIGLVTIVGGNGDGRAEGNPPQSSSADGGAESTAKPKPTPPATTRPTTSSSKPPTSSKPAPSTTGSTTSAGGDGEPGPAKQPLRVYNNSKIKGLADDAAADFRAAGWEVAKVDNYGSGIIPTTTVYFRPNTDEEAPARELAAAFGMRVEARFEGIQDADPGIIVIVTSDYQGQDGKTNK